MAFEDHSSFLRGFYPNMILRNVRVFAVANPSVVCLYHCLSSAVVYNVRTPYSKRRTFRQYFFATVYLCHSLTSVQNFTEIILEEPLRRGR